MKKLILPAFMLLGLTSKAQDTIVSASMPTQTSITYSVNFNFSVLKYQDSTRVSNDTLYFIPLFAIHGNWSNNIKTGYSNLSYPANVRYIVFEPKTVKLFVEPYEYSDTYPKAIVFSLLDLEVKDNFIKKETIVKQISDISGIIVFSGSKYWNEINLETGLYIVSGDKFTKKIFIQ